MNTKAKSKSEQKRRKKLDAMNEIQLKKLAKFQNEFRIYFPTQTDAIEVLKVEQATISRYLSGEINLPYKIAKRFQDHTKGKVLADDICFTD